MAVKLGGKLGNSRLADTTDEGERAHLLTPDMGWAWVSLPGSTGEGQLTQLLPMNWMDGSVLSTTGNPAGLPLPLSFVREGRLLF